MARVVPAIDTPLSECPTNLDLADPYHKRLAIAALGESDLRTDEAGEVNILATHYLVTMGETVDPDTGEVSQFPRLVLINRSGRTFVTTSTVVPHRLGAMLSLYGPEDWARGIPVCIRERKARRTGRTYHDLRVIGNPGEVVE